MLNLAQLQQLASVISAAYRGSAVDQRCVLALHKLAPAANFVSLSVLASDNLLVTAGSLTQEGQCSVTLVPTTKAAAALALIQNQSLQLDLRHVRRPSPFFDCEDALAHYNCTALAFVPIPALPGTSFRVGDIHVRGMGVLTLGVNSGLPVDVSVLAKSLTLSHLLTTPLSSDCQHVLLSVLKFVNKQQDLQRASTSSQPSVSSLEMMDEDMTDEEEHVHGDLKGLATSRC